MMNAAAAVRHGLLLRASSRRMLLPSSHKCWFSRKGAKMGRHLDTLDDLAHRESHELAKERRKEKKQHDKKHRIDAHHENVASLEKQEEVHEDVQFDEGDDQFHIEEDGLPELPDPMEVKQRMLKVVTRLTDSFKSIRGSEPTPEMFDPITVLAYGEKVPLSAVAQVVISSPTLATITCFDPQVAPEVRTAIQLAMELNPTLEEDGVIQVKLPRPTLESRQQTVKHLGKQAESGRQRIRGIRRAALDVVKRGKDGKLEGITKDDAFRAQKEIDSVTDAVVQQLNDAVEQKQQSVMAV